MVSTLSGNWQLWLIPLFLFCLVVMILATRSELGIHRKKAGEPTLVFNPRDFKPSPVYKKEEDEQRIAAAIAAVCFMETNGGYGKMKNLRITVDGKVYEVTVEEVSAKESAPDISQLKPASKETVDTPAEPAQQNISTKILSTKAVKVEAPMSGKVVDIVAKEGTTIAQGDTILIMEAMKLQSEICADCSGVIRQILVSTGQTLVSGEPVAIIE